MRKGRIFRRKHRFDPTIERLHDATDTLHQWQDDLGSAMHHSLHRMRQHGRELREALSFLGRRHPAATLLLAGTAAGLLLWAFLRRPHHHRAEGMEDHW